MFIFEELPLPATLVLSADRVESAKSSQNQSEANSSGNRKLVLLITFFTVGDATMMEVLWVWSEI